MPTADLEGLPDPSVPVGTFLIELSTARFDVASEPENDVNPIRGQSFLAWLRPQLESHGFEVEGPDTEDWGWYLEARKGEARYLIGASATEQEGTVDWIVQLRKLRRVSERLLGKNRMSGADPTFRWLLALLEEDERIEELSVQAG